MRPRPRVLGTLALLVLVAAACTTGSEPGDSSEAPGTTAGHTVRGVVLLDGDPDPDSDRISILVTYGGCSDGQLPQAVEEVRVTEDPDSVIIEALIGLPDTPIITTCPGNPQLPETVQLAEPLGDRAIFYRSTDPEQPDPDITVEIWPGEATAGAGTTPATMCTLIGCDSLLIINLSSTDILPGETYHLEICVDDRCTDNTITIDVRHPGTGEVIRGESERIPGTREGQMLIWSDEDRIDYHLPAGEYGNTASVTFELTDSDGTRLAGVTDATVHLERTQPNGPGCEPVCFWGELTA